MPTILQANKREVKVYKNCKKFSLFMISQKNGSIDDPTVIYTTAYIFGILPVFYQQMWIICAPIT